MLGLSIALIMISKTAWKVVLTSQEPVFVNRSQDSRPTSQNHKNKINTITNNFALSAIYDDKNLNKFQ